MDGNRWLLVHAGGRLALMGAAFSSRGLRGMLADLDWTVGNAILDR